MQVANLFVKKGSIFVYRLYDIADEINLKKAQSLLDQGPENVRRYRLKKDPLRTITFRDAPLIVSAGEEPLTLTVQDKPISLKSSLEVKIWNYGSISLCYKLELPEDINWRDLIYLGQVLEVDSVIDQVATKKRDEIIGRIKDSLKNPFTHPVFEDYMTYLLEDVEEYQKVKSKKDESQETSKNSSNSDSDPKMEGPVNKIKMKDPLELLKRKCVAELLLAEPKQVLAEGTRKSIQSNFSQYTKKDLIILDWNTALVVDFTSEKEYQDYVDIIEFSLAQLLKLRIYDQLLDEKLDELYESMETRQYQKMTTFYANLSEESGRLYLEFSDFFEKLDNSIKTIGDIYLAKVFRSTDKKFGFDEIKKSITRKIEALRELSRMCQDKVDSVVDKHNVQVSHRLEWIIIGLITIEVVPFLYTNLDKIKEFFVGIWNLALGIF